jgi:hypothetical protein
MTPHERRLQFVFYQPLPPSSESFQALDEEVVGAFIDDFADEPIRVFLSTGAGPPEPDLDVHGVFVSPSTRCVGFFFLNTVPLQVVEPRDPHRAEPTKKRAQDSFASVLPFRKIVDSFKTRMKVVDAALEFICEENNAWNEEDKLNASQFAVEALLLIDEISSATEARHKLLFGDAASSRPGVKQDTEALFNAVSSTSSNMKKKTTPEMKALEAARKHYKYYNKDGKPEGVVDPAALRKILLRVATRAAAESPPNSADGRITAELNARIDALTHIGSELARISKLVAASKDLARAASASGSSRAPDAATFAYLSFSVDARARTVAVTIANTSGPPARETARCTLHGTIAHNSPPVSVSLAQKTRALKPGERETLVWNVDQFRAALQAASKQTDRPGDCSFFHEHCGKNVCHVLTQWADSSSVSPGRVAYVGHCNCDCPGCLGQPRVVSESGRCTLTVFIGADSDRSDALRFQGLLDLAPQ